MPVRSNVGALLNHLSAIGDARTSAIFGCVGLYAYADWAWHKKRAASCEAALLSSDVGRSESDFDAGLEVPAEDTFAALHRIIAVGTIGDGVDRWEVVENVLRRHIEGELRVDFDLRRQIDGGIVTGAARQRSVVQSAV